MRPMVNARENAKGYQGTESDADADGASRNPAQHM